MKNLLLTSILVILSLFSFSQFSKNFQEKTLRFDYYHCGNSESEYFYFDELKEEPYWAGSKNSLIDTNGYGNQVFELWDLETKELIFSGSYCTLFGEWQTTPESKITEKCYAESIIMPFPNQKAKLIIKSRGNDGMFYQKFEYEIDPKSKFIKKVGKNYPVFDLHKSGKPENMVDVVLIPEGYSEKDKAVFEADCKQFTEDLFSYEPYKSNKSKFNIKAVWAASAESGTDMPDNGHWRNTILESSYSTFDSERYLMVNDFQKVRDIAGNAPYDYVYILANTDKYGGGAIYNFYGISAAHNEGSSRKIYIHEFGHLFAGLGDEYVGDVSYSDFYKTNIEPWEPNLTTLVNFEKKWKNMLPENTEIPTKINFENRDKLGVYEGGGYVTKGVYRPWINCLMNNFHTIDQFCPVCHKAIQDMIDFNCK